jgi:hypothetical protein
VLRVLGWQPEAIDERQRFLEAPIGQLDALRDVERRMLRGADEVAAEAAADTKRTPAVRQTFFVLVELRRIELLTSTLPVLRSPS